MWENSEIFGTQRANNDEKVVARRIFLSKNHQKAHFFRLVKSWG